MKIVIRNNWNAVQNNNSDKIGICLQGYFHPASSSNCYDTLTKKTKDSQIELCAFTCHSYKITSISNNSMTIA